MRLVANLPPWLSGLTLLELQCSEPGWLVRQDLGSSPAAAVMSSQVSACYETKILGQVQRVRLCPLSNVTGHHTRIGGIWVL